MKLSITMSPFDSKTKKMLKKLDGGVNELMSQVVNRVAGYGENQIGLQAKKDVYSYIPKTDSYRRTGRLLGGRTSSLPHRENLKPGKIKLEANAKLRGASFNYSPYVNSGTGWMKRVGARPFWDNAIKNTKDKLPNLIKEQINIFGK
jgi:hypothetical protein